MQIIFISSSISWSIWIEF